MGGGRSHQHPTQSRSTDHRSHIGFHSFGRYPHDLTRTPVYPSTYLPDPYGEPSSPRPPVPPSTSYAQHPSPYHTAPSNVRQTRAHASPFTVHVNTRPLPPQSAGRGLQTSTAHDHWDRPESPKTPKVQREGSSHSMTRSSSKDGSSSEKPPLRRKSHSGSTLSGTTMRSSTVWGSSTDTLLVPERREKVKDHDGHRVLADTRTSGHKQSSRGTPRFQPSLSRQHEISDH